MAREAFFGQNFHLASSDLKRCLVHVVNPHAIFKTMCKPWICHKSLTSVSLPGNHVLDALYRPCQIDLHSGPQHKIVSLAKPLHIGFRWKLVEGLIASNSVRVRCTAIQE